MELIQGLRELSNEPSEQFLRISENLFTNNKKDLQHNPSLKSCLLRIPGTIALSNKVFFSALYIAKFNQFVFPNSNFQIWDKANFCIL